MFKKFITIVTLGVALGETASASFHYPDQISAEMKALEKTFAADDTVNQHLSKAPELARQEGRELHLVLGAGPYETHIRNMIDQDMARERQEQEAKLQNPFKSPVRIFFTYDERACTKDSSPIAPVHYGNFNSLDDWERLLKLLHPNYRSLGGGSTVKFQGPVDKIYFDCSTNKFAQWDQAGMIRIAILLKPAGTIFLPDANLASQCVFGNSEITAEEHRKLREQDDEPSRAILKSLPYTEAKQPRPSSGMFFLGLCTNENHSRDGKNYVYNGTSLIYDTNYKAESISDRSRKLVGPLKFEAVASPEGYPNIGTDLRDADDFGRMFHPKTYVKVMKG